MSKFKLVFGVRIEMTTFDKKAYFGADVFGCGSDTLDEAEKLARGFVEKYVEGGNARVPGLYTGRFMVEVRRPCEACSITGIKTGCKRKKCPECSGLGFKKVASPTFTLGEPTPSDRFKGTGFAI